MAAEAGAEEEEEAVNDEIQPAEKVAILFSFGGYCAAPMGCVDVDVIGRRKFGIKIFTDDCTLDIN